MKAAVYREAGRLGIEEIPVPEIAAGELLVQVDTCGVCLTDVKKIEKGLLPGPRVFGHEIAGRVARAGAGVTRFREGDRVVVHHHVPCGACFYCARLRTRCHTSGNSRVVHRARPRRAERCR